MKNILQLKYLLLIVLLCLSFSCNKSDSNTNKITYKIGALLSVTGVASNWGSAAHNGAMMAIEEINSTGGVFGTPLELLLEDNQSQATKGITNFKKLKSEGVNLFIGDVWDFLTNPLISFIDKTKSILISPTVVNDSVRYKSDYFFTLGPKAENISNAVREYLNKHSNVKTYSAIYTDEPWGIAYSNAVKKVMQEFKISLLLDQPITGYDSKFEVETLKIKNANPDLLFVLRDQDKIFPLLKSLNFTNLVLTSDDVATYYKNKKTRDILPFSFSVIEWPQTDRFITSYQKRFNQYPYFEAIFSYEAIYSLYYALLKDSNNPLKALRTMSLEHASGKIDFSKGFAANFSEARINEGEVNYSINPTN